jgi:hypothetical protein
MDVEASATQSPEAQEVFNVFMTGSRQCQHGFRKLAMADAMKRFLDLWRYCRFYEQIVTRHRVSNHSSYLGSSSRYELAKDGFVPPFPLQKRRKAHVGKTYSPYAASLS